MFWHQNNVDTSGQTHIFPQIHAAVNWNIRQMIRQGTDTCRCALEVASLLIHPGKYGDRALQTPQTPRRQQKVNNHECYRLIQGRQLSIILRCSGPLETCGVLPLSSKEVSDQKSNFQIRTTFWATLQFDKKSNFHFFQNDRGFENLWRKWEIWIWNFSATKSPKSLLTSRIILK